MEVSIEGMYALIRVRNNEDLWLYNSRQSVDLRRLVEWGRKADQVWMVSAPLSVYVTTPNETTEFRFRPGYVTDLATVPKLFRGIIDNDDLRLIAPSLVHDYYFGTQELSFCRANKLMFQMIRALGGSMFKAVVAWLAISSPFGWFKFRKFRLGKASHLRRRCDIITVRKE